MNLKIEVDREDDGRWIAEVMELPGCMAYGKTKADALAGPRRSRCACWRIAWRTASLFLPVTSCFRGMSHWGSRKSAARPRGFATNRLDDQTATRHFPSNPRPTRLARRGVCFP